MDKNGTAWPSRHSLAQDCHIAESTVSGSIDRLLNLGLLTVERAGRNARRQTNRYRIPGWPDWKKDVSENEPPDAPAVSENRTARVRKSDGPCPKIGHKLEPRTRPKKKTQKYSCSKSEIETIYRTYPRKVGKKKAMLAIEKALREIAKRDGMVDAADWLLARVKEFAASPAGQAGAYTPHPTTWMNHGRYDDDPKEWSRSDDGKAVRTGARKPPTTWSERHPGEYASDPGEATRF